MKHPVSTTSAILAALLVGCSGRKAAESSQPLMECEGLTAVYDACLKKLGPEGAELAKQRVAAVRASFDKPPASEAERAAMRARCAATAKQLAASCR